MTNPAPISPCINVCRLDPANMCVGCGRLLSEIAAWSRMSPEQQRTACELAAQRLRAAAKGESRMGA